MYKIAVGTNIYGDCSRQTLGIQSLINCKSIIGDRIELFNIQFEDGTDLKEIDGFQTLRCLNSTSNDVCGGDRKLPLIKEMFDSLSDLGYDYFCFINSDILVSPKYFNEILNNDYDAFIASRLSITGDIQNLDFSIDINVPGGIITNSHYQVSGFDGFTIKNDWWKKNRTLFPDYVYAVV